ncbi:MAG: DNA topoisomerase VI subunit B, partial [Thermoprotei archaeon]
SITLSPLGERLLKEGVKNILKPEFVTAVTRPPSSYGGNPFIVEVALGYGGEIPSSDAPLLLRFANRIPLLYDEGADVSKKVINSIDWNIYKIKFPAPLAIVTHVCSTKVPFKGVGKEAIADVPEVEKEIKIAIREAARRLKRHLSRIEKMFEIKRREVTIKRYMNEVSRSLSYISGIEEEKLKDLLLRILKEDIKRRESSKAGEKIVKKAIVSR